MASWLDNLIKPFRGEEPSALSLGAFGKHPGWDDHIEDFGLDTEALLAARQLLYVQGIGGVIDSGAWDKMEAKDTLPAFGHLAIWFGDADLLVARMWASQDRKGRARYPMVICAHVTKAEPRAALNVILPALEAAERDCRAATTAEAVQSILEALRESLRQKLAPGTQASPPPLPLNGQKASIPARLGLAADGTEWQRILYGAESQLAAYATGKIPDALKRISMKLPTITAMAQQMRLPSDETALAEVVLFWKELFTHVLHASAPMLFLQPLGHPWLDLIVGSPGVKQLVCLKSSTSAIPLLQEVPYNLPEGFREKAAQTFQECCAGK